MVVKTELNWTTVEMLFHYLTCLICRHLFWSQVSLFQVSNVVPDVLLIFYNPGNHLICLLPTLHKLPVPYSFAPITMSIQWNLPVYLADVVSWFIKLSVVICILDGIICQYRMWLFDLYWRTYSERCPEMPNGFSSEIPHEWQVTIPTVSANPVCSHWMFSEEDFSRGLVDKLHVLSNVAEETEDVDSVQNDGELYKRRKTVNAHQKPYGKDNMKSILRTRKIFR